MFPHNSAGVDVFFVRAFVFYNRPVSMTPMCGRIARGSTNFCPPNCVTPHRPSPLPPLPRTRTRAKSAWSGWRWRRRRGPEQKRTCTRCRCDSIWTRPSGGTLSSVRVSILPPVWPQGMRILIVRWRRPKVLEKSETSSLS